MTKKRQLVQSIEHTTDRDTQCETFEIKLMEILM
jgi:hypothetical protein